MNEEAKITQIVKSARVNRLWDTVLNADNQEDVLGNLSQISELLALDTAEDFDASACTVEPEEKVPPETLKINACPVPVAVWQQWTPASGSAISSFPTTAGSFVMSSPLERRKT